MVNWGAAVPIVVAIIGISGVVLPAFSSVFINQIYNKPSVNIDIGTKPERGKQIINITNSGTIPATNLSLILTANNKIINNVTNLLSTVNVFLANPRPPSLLEINHLKPINGLLLELHVKKFVNGGGSIIKLAIGAKGTTYKDYVVYATYDQGSKKKSAEEPSVIYYLAIFTFTGGNVLYFIVAELIVLVYIGYRKKTRARRRFLQKITKEMIDVRKSLRRDLLTRDTLPVPFTHPDANWTMEVIYPVWPLVNIPIDNREIISENYDYIRVDDFYSKLVERKSYVEDNEVIDDFELAELNKQCLELAEDALTKIDWSKYR